jgi:hypothetical protein
MKCNNCGCSISKTWKVCPKCANELVNNNLPFKAKYKGWIDKHLLLINIFCALPFNLLYTLLPGWLVYYYFVNYSTNGDALNINNVFTTLIGVSAIFPFLLVVFVLIFIKSTLKSFLMARYAVKTTNDTKYNYFILGNIICLLVAVVLVVLYVF